MTDTHFDSAIAAATVALERCTCQPYPAGDGPERDCPIHGDSRHIAYHALTAAAEHLIAAGVERERDRVKGIASGPFTGEEGLDSFTLGWILARIDPPPGFPCSRCGGEGFTADDDDRTPWSFWANLQPPANLAVTLGLVHKVRCERCAGTGREENLTVTTTYYKAVRPDGTSFHDPDFRWVPESGPVEGVVVTHPAPHNEDPSGWLSVATVPTDCTGMRWPCRLLTVAPVEGHPVTAPWGNSPNKRAASAWHVVGELPATDALGPQGVEVAAIIERASRLTPDEIARLRNAEWDAARDAAWDAAWVAAWDAARDAGRDAAWDAATHAARDAAWVAGRDAARYAAWDAAIATLTRDIITPEQYDTLMGLWRQAISHREGPADE